MGEGWHATADRAITSPAELLDCRPVRLSAFRFRGGGLRHRFLVRMTRSGVHSCWGIGESIRFVKPAGYRLFHLVPVSDLNNVSELGFRDAIDASYLWGLQRVSKEHTEFQKIPLRTNEEVAGFPREHDRFVRGVDPLISKRSGGLAQSLPGVPEIFREILCENSLRGRPAVMLLPVLHPLLAVEALSNGHGVNSDDLWAIPLAHLQQVTLGSRENRPSKSRTFCMQMEANAAHCR